MIHNRSGGAVNIHTRYHVGTPIPWSGAAGPCWNVLRRRVARSTRYGRAHRAASTSVAGNGTIGVMMTPEQQSQPANSLSALETARLMVDAATDKKAQDILLLDVRKISSLA